MTRPTCHMILGFFLFVFLTFTVSSILSQPSESEAHVLQEIYKHGKQPWNSSTSPCEWPGVQCIENSVTGILLGGSLADLSSIPASICKLTNLTNLDLSANSLTGAIPKGFGKLPRLESLCLNNNSLSGSIPSGLFQLKSLIFIDLGGNQLSGEIPMLTDAMSLVDIDLSANYLTGAIPKGFGKLPRLESLRLNNNSLSGSIPTTLSSLAFLWFLDLSYNNLSGKLPCALYVEAYRDKFIHNPNLDFQNCYAKNKSLSFWHVVLIVIGAIIVIMVLSLLFRSKANVMCQQTNHMRQQITWELTAFHKLNFTDSKVVSSLIEDNVIGSGGSGKVYCIDTDDSGTKVAVKRIWNNRKLSNELQKQFAAEVEILGKIRHANIVKLLCCISSEDSKLLVYEYMENQSLDKWLHRKDQEHESSSTIETSVNWPTRLSIAIGAAKGLSYMHHDCLPPIIHRDVKSSNVLLDSEFNAKVADFGLARFSPNKDGGTQTVSTVAGSFGYIAPEYWRTKRLNEKIDIYSFGVVLLELATGKEPTRGNDYLNLADWSRQHYCEGNPLENALDIKIKEPQYLEEMKNVFKLGLMCTTTIPSSRPSMKEVVQLLTSFAHRNEVLVDTTTLTTSN